MPDFKEMMEDVGGDIKNTFKKKPFLIAVVVVVVIALIVWWRNRSGGSSTGGSEYYYPSGYGGYPTTGGSSEDTSGGGGGGSFDNSIYDQLVKDNDSLLDKMDQMQGQYDDVLGGLQDDIFHLGNAFTESKNQNESLRAEAERQNLLSQMRSNSELYNALGTTNAGLRENLHQQNMDIASSLGLRYDSVSGNYFDSGGKVAYTTSKQQAQSNNNGNNPSVGNSSRPGYGSTNVSYDPRKDYQAAINDAIRQGASSSVINSLNSERDAKIAASGGSSGGKVQYDKNADYTTLINQAKQSGASQSVINNLEAQRNQKIADDPSLKKYANDTKSSTSSTSTKVSSGGSSSSSGSKTSSSSRGSSSSSSSSKTSSSSSNSTLSNAANKLANALKAASAAKKKK